MGLGTGFGFGSIGSLTRRARGADFSKGGRGSGEVVTNFSTGRRTGGLHRRRRYRRARSRGRYTWFRWRSARCERLDCDGNDGARDRHAQAVDDEGVTGQNSGFGPDDAVSRDEPNNILYIPAVIRRARSRPFRGTAPVGIEKAWRAQIGRGQLTGRDGRAPSQFEQSTGIARIAPQANDAGTHHHDEKRVDASRRSRFPVEHERRYRLSSCHAGMHDAVAGEMAPLGGGPDRYRGNHDPRGRDRGRRLSEGRDRFRPPRRDPVHGQGLFERFSGGAVWLRRRHTPPCCPVSEIPMRSCFRVTQMAGVPTALQPVGARSAQMRSSAACGCKTFATRQPAKPSCRAKTCPCREIARPAQGSGQ